MSRSGEPNGGCAGFTLIEVLVGLGIMVLLVGMIQGIYAAAVRSRQAAEERTATIHAVSTIFSKMCDELSASFVSKPRADQTFFRMTTDSSGQSTLEFTTLLPTVHGLRAGGETRIRYAPDPDRDSPLPEKIVLKRTEIDDLFKDLERDGVTYQMLKGINHFKVTCYNGEEWLENWDNTDPQNPKLPRAVRLTVTWGDKDNEESLFTSTTVYGGLL